ncbi:MAG: AMP-binding protein, partial [Dinoroseobacter sp.]|nr:AMP-binding protein [Dinoroseobacter sp.]
IGGDGLALGYLGQPDLTASAFRDVKIAGQHTRLYKTGDLAIREADGHLRLLGRRDGQIKLRGFRIELGEIEARLRAHPSVSAAAVALAKGSSGIDQLAAYVVPQNNEDLDQDMLKRSLADQLPDYMVPTAWSVVEALPQTTNGKLDRKALPSLRTEGSAPKKAVDLPSGETETKIAAIWGTVLGLENTSVTATLFQLGTDSLGIFRLAARLMEAGFEIEARDVFANPSVRALAAHIDAAKPNKPKRPSLKDFTRTPRTGT